MRSLRLLVILLASLYGPASIVAQQASSSAPAPRDAQSVLVLQHSLAALVGTTTISDVTLSGTANWIAGSDNETGTATLKATAIGQGRVDLNLSNGPRSEVVDVSQVAPTGSWSGSDGTWHSIAGHNLFNDPAWFYPAFLLRRVLSNSNYAVTPADVETKSGVSVEHFAVYEQVSQTDTNATLIPSLSRTDIYLDASTQLPLAVAFNTHPDKDAQTNIPTEIRFSNYQIVQGIAVPYHVQRYIQNGLALDVTITGVQVNSGLSATDFQAQ